jgi:hypothetical protein
LFSSHVCFPAIPDRLFTDSECFVENKVDKWCVAMNGRYVPVSVIFVSSSKNSAKVKQEPQGLVSPAAQICFIEKLSAIFTWQ